MAEKETKTLLPGRDENNRFLPGYVQNPGGRGKGNISPMTRVREIFKEDPEGYELWIREYIKDPAHKKHIVEMLEGKPKQQIEHAGDAVMPFVINVSKYKEDKPERKQVTNLKEITQGPETAEANGGGAGDKD